MTACTRSRTPSFGALVAVLTQPPLHDLGMLTFLLGWAAVGFLRLRQGLDRQSVTA